MLRRRVHRPHRVQPVDEHARPAGAVCAVLGVLAGVGDGVGASSELARRERAAKDHGRRRMSGRQLGREAAEAQQVAIRYPAPLEVRGQRR